MKESEQKIKLSNFNSIKVRLERVTGRKGIRFHAFQFHKGAIRTFMPDVDDAEDSHFNSIKVRLEPTIAAGIYTVNDISIP